MRWHENEKLKSMTKRLDAFCEAIKDFWLPFIFFQYPIEKIFVQDFFPIFVAVQIPWLAIELLFLFSIEAKEDLIFKFCYFFITRDNRSKKGKPHFTVIMLNKTAKKKQRRWVAALFTHWIQKISNLKFEWW